MAQFYDWLGQKKSRGIRLAVMDMWKPFRNATRERGAAGGDPVRQVPHHAPSRRGARQGAQDRIRAAQRQGSALHQGAEIHAALAPREPHPGGQADRSRLLLAANKRLNTAYLLKESFGQLWDYEREGWARRFFENWRASLKWQRLEPYENFAEMIDRHWDGIAAYCKPENKVSLGFVEGLNNKIRVIQTPRLRATRRGISAPQGPHLHASGALKWPKSPTRLPEDPQKILEDLSLMSTEPHLGFCKTNPKCAGRPARSGG